MMESQVETSLRNAKDQDPDKDKCTGRCVADLLALAAEGLGPMFDPQHQLFCFTLRQSEGGLVREGLSPRYTMMTLLGLHRLEAAGGTSPVAIHSVLGRLMADTSWIEGIGDLGLLLWSCAVIVPERFPELAQKLDARNALPRYKDARQGKTMELAWFLTGLSHGLHSQRGQSLDLFPQAQTTFRMLTANQGAKGIFGHMARAKSVAGRLRGAVGSFADQVYPVYAFAQFAKLEGEQEASSRALDCSQTICEHQGPFGEWWWHYDSVTGGIAETYPVYSVHQDGMAPMALFAISEATGTDFSDAIKKGLAWIGGNNDLQFDMRNQPGKLIWRNFYLPGAERHVRQVLGMSREPGQVPVRKLKVNHECRPYELGWALYALAGRGFS
jgi:hypothetical protein